MASAPPLITRPFLLLALADLAYFTAVGIAVYAIPLYATGPLGSTEAGAGVAFGAFAVSALLLRPYAGRLCDTVGRLPLLVAGALVAGVALALTAAAESLAVLVALRLLAGVAEAAFFVASLAVLIDIAPPARIGEALSYNSLGLYLGLAFGPPLGELLVETWSFAVAWFVAGALSVVGALAVLGIGETREGGARVGHAKLIHRGAVPASVGFFASLLAVGGFLSMAALHAHDVGLADTSLPLFVYGAVVVVCRVLFARVPDRLPALGLASAALATIAVGLGVMAVWGSPTGMLAGAALIAVGVTFSTPAFFSAIFATAKPSDRGAASGTASMAIDLGLGFGPIALGVVAHDAGIPAALLVGACFAGLGTLWMLRLFRASVAAA